MLSAFLSRPLVRLLSLAVALTAPSLLFAEPVPMTHKVLIADEGNSQIHYINLANPAERWSVSTLNRDMQLIGNDRVMVSVGDGYAEYDIETGALIKKVTTSVGWVQSAFRLGPSATWVGSDGSPATLVKVDSLGNSQETISFALDASIRILRPTPENSYLVGGTAAGVMYECDSTGAVIWEANAGGQPYMALRLPNGNTLISTGYGGQMVLVDAQAQEIRRFPENTGGDAFWDAARPNFFAGFQILENGNIVVSNWEGHGGGNGGTGYQLLEFDSTGAIVSYWDQDESLVSSLHGVIVLDGLNTDVMHSDINGIMAPIGTTQVRPESRTFIQSGSFISANAHATSMLRIIDTRGRLVHMWSGKGYCGPDMRALAASTYLVSVTSAQQKASIRMPIVGNLR